MKFFKKIGYSIAKIEKYAEMATEGTKSAIMYLAGITLILTIVFSLGTVYETHDSAQKVAEYIEQNVPEFSYKDGNISMEGEQPITLERDSTSFNKIIIDTEDNVSEDKISEFKSEIKKEESGILILKDKAILIDSVGDREVTYTYTDLTSQLEMNEFTKSDAVNYLRGDKFFKMYLGVLLTVLIYAFITYLIEGLCIAVIIAAIGYIVALLLKVRMRYKAIFNMAVYAMTLSVLLQTVYIGINIFTDFTITYFDIMYTGVAFIYLVAAIFLTRIDLAKHQEELTKIKEVQKEVREEMKKEEEKKEEENKKETDDKKEKQKEEKPKDEKQKKQKKQKNTENQDGEPEGI